jgi:hypothetical protein
MSEQEQDFNSFQEHLERIFKDLEDGVFITADEIGDLRYACGLPVKPRQEKSASGQAIWNMLIDMNVAIQKGMK